MREQNQMENKSPIRMAIEANDTKMIDALLNNKYYDNLNEVYKDKSLLSAAISTYGGLQSIEKLFNLGVRPEVDNFLCLELALNTSKHDILVFYIKNGYGEQVKNLKKKTRIANIFNLETEINPIHDLIISDNYKLDIETLNHYLSIGLNINDVEKHGYSPIFMVKTPEAFETLVALGADVNVKTNAGVELKDHYQKHISSETTRNNILLALNKYSEIEGVSTLKVITAIKNNVDNAVILRQMKESKVGLFSKNPQGVSIFQQMSRSHELFLIKVFNSRRKIEWGKKDETFYPLSTFAYNLIVCNYRKKQTAMISSMKDELLNKDAFIKHGIDDFKKFVDGFLIENTRHDDDYKNPKFLRSTSSNAIVEGVAMFTKIFLEMGYGKDVSENVFQIQEKIRDNDKERTARMLVDCSTHFKNMIEERDANGDHKNVNHEDLKSSLHKVYQAMLDFWLYSTLEVYYSCTEQKMMQKVLTDLAEKEYGFEITDNFEKRIDKKTMTKETSHVLMSYIQKLVIKKEIKEVSKKALKVL